MTEVRVLQRKLENARAKLRQKLRHLYNHMLKSKNKVIQELKQKCSKMMDPSALRKIFTETQLNVIKAGKSKQTSLLGSLEPTGSQQEHAPSMCQGQVNPGHYDKCVSAVKERHKEDMGSVVLNIFSHSQVTKKNVLVVELINALCTTDPGLTDDLASILSDLTLLNNSENSKVALRARQWQQGVGHRH
ncbi:unnamed protein product [Darwinula stevensoni]|uniref:Acetyl-CoA carboxylase central domain-containing protein n=1 Tax=Darwinula stevensoni TaxID=69355 RepID=A0A7R9FQV1_9CRUS|nr:unnamed protein product [Darwinula stevensoni]CAG0900431.1 unnamed protein product [Darwinula stevensoni]